MSNRALELASQHLPIGDVLRRQAGAVPEQVMLRMGREEWSFADADRLSDAVAAGLLDHGVQPGDVVALMLPNCAEYLWAWFGLNKLGAAAAGINTAFRGSGLAHMLSLARSRLIILDARWVNAVAAVLGSLPDLRTVVVHGPLDEARERLRGCTVIAFEELAAGGGAPRDPSRDTDLALLLYTSGTTGRSKACMLSHRFLLHAAASMGDHLGFSATDVLYCPFPLFHADATYLTTLPALLTGCTAAVGERFSVSRFWDEIRQSGATVFDFMGATLDWLFKQPPRADDRRHSVRLAWGVPRPPWAPAFEERFGIQVVDGYGLTEAGVPVARPLAGSVPAGSSGRAVYPYQVRIVDEADTPLAAGQAGEIVIRSDLPWTLMDGYFGMPDETMHAFRNQWFHTGDLGRLDAEGFFYFVGRKKDAIRRRGENISAFEVEEIVSGHEAVLECAAFGVPAADGEEEVMLAVVLRDGRTLSPQSLIAYCAERMARFMVPRYVEFRPSLPKTPTEKVEKYRLAAEGITRETWDAVRSTYGPS